MTSKVQPRIEIGSIAKEVKGKNIKQREQDRRMMMEKDSVTGAILEVILGGKIQRQ